MSEFTLRRLEMVMEPEAENSLEAEGVLNPAAARGPDVELYLFSANGRKWDGRQPHWCGAPLPAGSPAGRRGC